MEEVFDLAARAVVTVTSSLRGCRDLDKRVRGVFESLANMLTPVRPGEAKLRVLRAKAWVARQVGKWESRRERRHCDGLPRVAGAVINACLDRIVELASGSGESLASYLSVFSTTCKWLSELAPYRVNVLPRVWSASQAAKIKYEEVIAGMLK
ncbi:MAG: hypothetical protein DRK00_11195 [Thermoprotei archaeon]|nr:MAG: hypothetical protein DRK00_11195 [Thermoprotei archaeon]